MRRALRGPRPSRARVRSVIVAGTNGKGSVTAMTVGGAPRRAATASARYTSPHLERLEERFVIDGREVDDAPTLRDAAGGRATAPSKRLVA